MIDRLQGFFGLSRTPFGRDLAPGMLHRHAHGEEGRHLHEMLQHGALSQVFQCLFK